MSDITYTTTHGILLEKCDKTHFDSSVKITVPENCAAVLFYSGQVLDVIENATFALTPENIPLAAKLVDVTNKDGFDIGICFVNKTESVSFEWQTESGAAATAEVRVGDYAKFVSGLLAFTDLEYKSVVDYIQKFVKGVAEHQALSLEDIGAAGTVSLGTVTETEPEPEPAPETTEPEPAPETEPETTEPETETEPEPETEAAQSTPKKSSPVKKIAIAAIIIGIAICLAVAIFFRPDGDTGTENNPGSVVDQTGPKDPIAEEDREYTDIAKAQIGDYVQFGSYEQDADLDNGKEPLGWVVADIVDGNLVLVTEKCIDTVQYNVTRTDIEWKESSIRKWLGGEFYKTAFTEAEQAQILTTTNKNALDTNYDLENGNNTDDKVYLMSITEVKTYFGGSEALRQTKATAYAASRGAYVDDEHGCCRWWLRSPGDAAYNAAIVENDGYVANHGDGVDSTLTAVRPVIRISTSK